MHRVAVAGLALFVASFAAPASAQAPSPEPTVVPATRYSTSAPIRDMAALPHIYRNPAPFVVAEQFPYRFDSQPIPEMRPGLVDPVLDAPAPNAAARAGLGTVLNDFEGTSAAGTAPPDPTGDIGPNHYVQMVNSRTAIYNRAGTLLLGPVNNNTFWTGAGGLCEVNNDGDPIVLYDETADRWLISQFVSVVAAPYAMCVAISATPDPTGAYHRYEFSWPEGFPDYPKFGIWPTGYALATSLFPDAGGSFSQAVMLERDQMLVGGAAQSIRFTMNDGTTNEYYSMLPADFTGPAPPPGTPALFAGLRLSSGVASDREVIRMYTLTPDWATPANSTLSYLGGLPVAPFDVYALFQRANAIPQLGTADRIAGLGHRPMMQLQYRNVGGTGRLLFNHTIAVNDITPTRTGVRWYELRDPGTGWSIHQQGTYAPSDTHFRWVGSMAMNDAGDIGLAYSVSSSAMHPSIRFTGQTAAMSGTGVMDVTEKEILAGTGSQVGTANRWGDYSHLSVDPADGSSFWFTNLYYQTTSSFNWRTRIAHLSLETIDPAIFAFSPKSISASLETDETTTETLALSNAAAPGAQDLTWTAEIQYLTAPAFGGDTPTSGSAAAPEAGGPIRTEPEGPGIAETEGAPVRAEASALRAPESRLAASDKAAVLCSDGQVIEQATNTNNFTVHTTNEYGQSFIAPCSGFMTSVVPNLLGTGAGAFQTVTRLYDGLGVLGTVLATVPNTVTPPASGFYEIDYTFPSPVEVVEGQTYTWFMDIVSGTSAMSVNTSDVYPGGSRWRSQTGNVADAFATSGDLRWRGTFSATNSWLSVSATSGTLAPGASTLLDVGFDATGLADGTYTAQILLTSNDPDKPSEAVPVTLVVGAGEAVMVLATEGVHVLAPAAAGMTVADLAALNLVWGVPGYAANGRANLFTDYGDGTWFPATGAGEVLELGRAFRWYVLDGDEDFGSGSVRTSLPTILSTDTPNTADVTLDLETVGVAINMLGNPFGTPLDMSSVASWPGGTKVGFPFLWDSDTRGFVYDPGATAPPWQAFFVRTRPGRTGTLTIPASAAMGSAAWAAASKTEAPALGTLRFGLDGTALDGSALSDGALALVVGADLDDEAKLRPMSEAYVAAGFAGTDALGAIAALRADGGSVELPIAVTTAGAERDLVLRWSAPTDLPVGWRLTLVDRTTGTETDLSRAGAVAFHAPSAPARALSAEIGGIATAEAEARFVLRVDTGDGTLAKTGEAGFELALAPPFPNPTSEQARVPFTLAAAGAVRLSVIDALGREVAVLVEGERSEGAHAATLDTRRLASGMYVIRLAAGGEVLVQRATVVR